MSKPSVNQRVDRGQQVAGLVALALVAPEPREAGGGAQLEGLRLLRARDVDGVVEEASASAGLAAGGEDDLALQPMQLGVEERLPRLRCDGEPRLDGAARLGELPRGQVRLAEQSEIAGAPPGARLGA